MIDLDAREAEILNGLKDFQRATVDRVVEQFRAGQRRVLVADEVGLGKTLIAKGVIARVANWHRKSGDDIFRVVYICSNQSIARQNIMKLKIDKEVVVDDDSSTRLTMQTLKYFRQKNDQRLLDAFVQLTPLTPQTSFAPTAGRGIVWERALLYAVLRRVSYLAPYADSLSRLLCMDVKHWAWWSNTWVEDEIAKSGPGYVESVVPTVEAVLSSEKYSWLQDRLVRACEEIAGGADARRHAHHLVHHLRRLMADISISYLEPDLVIMDEFQRFRELIRTDEQSEIGMLARKFLHENGCKVLLLSATPYKLYSTLEEIDDNNGADDHYREFDEVVRFLQGNDTADYQSFRRAWESYSLALRRLERISVEEYREHKAQVEDSLYAVMCRTERLQVADIGRDMVDVHGVKPVRINPDDIASYVAADQVVQELSQKGKSALPPVEYVKSAPFIFSFMEHYQLKKQIRRYQDELAPVLKRSSDCWIPRDAIERYETISYPNARLNRLLEETFAQHGEQLLWIPPSLPYYQLSGPFKGTEGFSKILVFSAWEMVPRMIASLVSYEAERRTIGDPAYQPRSGEEEKRYSPVGENQHRFPLRKLEFRASANREGWPESMSLFALLYPCRTLAEAFDPLEIAREAGCTLPLKKRDVESRLRKTISQLLEHIRGYQNQDIGRRDLAWYWLAPLLMDIERYGQQQVLSWISQVRQKVHSERGEGVRSRDGAGKYYQEHLAALERAAADPQSVRVGPMPNDLMEVLIRQTLGSPATCALRMLLQGLHTAHPSQDQPFPSAFQGAHQIALALRSRFNTPESTAIVDRCYKDSKEFHWRNVLRYCTDGNLQAVLDEYGHMLRDSYALHELDAERRIQQLAQLISQSLATNTASYKVDTYSGFTSKGREEEKVLRMRSHYAVGFYNVKSDNDQDVQRTDQLRQAFNSPFWPFVLASTSIGQEGLDFHYYCRKICHWNLPANPIDLEQREGRINRYKGLAIRLAAVKRYRDCGGVAIRGNVWDSLFEHCKSEEQGDHCELIPYWYLQPDAHSRNPGRIERIVPMYPFSKDEAQYERLVSILSLYRITMGQARQEELLESIAHCIDAKDRKALQEWFILLSPYYRRRLQRVTAEMTLPVLGKSESADNSR